MRYLKTASVTFFILAFSQSNIFGLPKSSSKLKTLAVDYVEADAKMIQQMVDMIFSFGELGFQEIETSKYLVAILKKMVSRFRKEYRECPLHGWLNGAQGNLLSLLVQILTVFQRPLKNQVWDITTPL